MSTIKNLYCIQEQEKQSTILDKQTKIIIVVTVIQTEDSGVVQNLRTWFQSVSNVNHKSIFNICFEESLHCCVNIIHRYDFDVWFYIVFSSKINHFLRLFHPSNATARYCLSPCQYINVYTFIFIRIKRFKPRTYRSLSITINHKFRDSNDKIQTLIDYVKTYSINEFNTHTNVQEHTHFTVML